MTNLYTRLFTYRAREHRHPTEDFLTEALADLFNRLPEALNREVAAYLLGSGPEVLAALKRVWPPRAGGRWETQRTIPSGKRLDLVLAVAGRPLIVVENKIGAAFQEHGEAVGAGAVDRVSQLATYGHWLAGEADAQWGGGLVLLTHGTPPPSGFGHDPLVYGCRFQHTARWSDLARWLQRCVAAADDPRSDWAGLAHDLVQFLREQQMDSDLATGADWAALRVYLGSADRVRTSIEAVWERLEPLWYPLCINREIGLEITSLYKCAWKYRYLAKDSTRRCYLAYGVRFPDRTNGYYEFGDDGEPYMFLEVGSDLEDDAGLAAMTLPSTWHSEDNLRLAMKPLRELPADPDTMISQLEEWGKARLTELVQALG